MIHPFMSEWYEWPIMNCHSVPFASSSRGGQIKAQGNPAVWFGVFGNFVLITLLAVCAGGAQAAAACARPAAAGRKGAQGAASRAPRELLAAKGAALEGPPPPEEAPGAPAEELYTPPQGWLIPFVVLWSGYLLNLVPYVYITRSKVRGGEGG